MEVWIWESVLDDLRKISKKHFPNEASSLLVGKYDGKKTAVVESIESKHEFESPVAFKVDPNFVINTIDKLESTEIDLVGFFHSHPKKPPSVSPRDERFMKNWGKKIWLIANIGKGGKLGEIEGFRWDGNGPEKLDIKVVQ